MKRYWLFAGEFYYASGGMSDFRGCFEEVGDAKKIGEDHDWYQIFDAEEMNLVETSQSLAYNMEFINNFDALNDHLQKMMN